MKPSEWIDHERFVVALTAVMLIAAATMLILGTHEWFAGITAAEVAILIVWRVAQVLERGQLVGAAWRLALLVPAVVLCYGGLYAQTGLREGGEVRHDFLTAVYFSVVTWTTLGYGDLQPTPEARPIAAVEALLGFVTMGILIAALASRGLRAAASPAGGTSRGTNQG